MPLPIGALATLVVAGCGVEPTLGCRAACEESQVALTATTLQLVEGTAAVVRVTDADEVLEEDASVDFDSAEDKIARVERTPKVDTYVLIGRRVGQTEAMLTVDGETLTMTVSVVAR